MGYYRQFQLYNLVTSLPLTRNAFHKTHFIALCTVFISVMNLTLCPQLEVITYYVMWIGAENVGSTFGRVLCDMMCCVLKMGHKLKFDHGVCFLWNDGLYLKKRISQVSLNLMGLLLLVLWKRSKENIFCYQALKKQKKRVSWNKHTALVLISYSSI